MKPFLTDEQRARLHTLLKEHRRHTKRIAQLREGLQVALEEYEEGIRTLEDEGSDLEVLRYCLTLLEIRGELLRRCWRTEARLRAVESEVASTPELRAWVLAAARENE